MHKDLPDLARDLRQETCPQRVHDEVSRRIAGRARAPRGFRPAVPWALAGALALLLLGGLAMWYRPARESRGPSARPAELAGLDRMRLARQTEGALGIIGGILRDAGAHSEKVILERAVPPLRNSLQTARNKISPRTEL
jgi:hypothetical protein